MKFAICLVLLGALALAVPRNKIEYRLATSLRTRGSANILVTMKEQTTSALATLKGRKYASRNERLNTVAHTLMDFASVSQSAARELLDSLKVPYEVFWITNMIYIRGATPEVVHALTTIDNVSEISEEFEVKLDPVIQGEHIPRTPGVFEVEWGVGRIRADEAWEHAEGTDGAGCIIASIDTGVLASHVDIIENFLPEYGWRDRTFPASMTPRDGNGHGTHTIGTACGKNGIGVAPGAKCMACQALTATGSGTNAALLGCGQFVLCPTHPDGSKPDCTKAPHVVNCSWGGGQMNTFYDSTIEALKAAGIIPVFANGNSGPSCSTANSPADSKAGVISVGATNAADHVAYFSSKGPTADGRQNPVICAPGESIRSAWNTRGNVGYNTISGTSMAAPHIAGLICLIKAKYPDMEYEQMAAILTSSANKNQIGETGMNCGGRNETHHPNDAHGHGFADCVKAIEHSLPQP